VAVGYKRLTTPPVQRTLVSKVYLAGPIKRKERPNWWRGIVTTVAPFETINPLDCPEPDEVRYPTVVSTDKQLIDDADAVLARYEDLPMVGTPMEQQYAHQTGTPCYVWWSREDSVSGWASEHAVSVHQHLGTCIEAIKQDL